MLHRYTRQQLPLHRSIACPASILGIVVFAFFALSPLIAHAQPNTSAKGSAKGSARGSAKASAKGKTGKDSVALRSDNTPPPLPPIITTSAVRISTPNLGISDRQHVQMNLDSIHIDFDPRGDEHDSTTVEITHLQARITDSGLKGVSAQVLGVQRRGPHWSIVLALSFDKPWENYSAGNYGALELEISARCTSKKSGKSSIDAKGKVNFVI